jgi:hypothetical protein
VPNGYLEHGANLLVLHLLDVAKGDDFEQREGEIIHRGLQCGLLERDIVEGRVRLC